MAAPIRYATPIVPLLRVSDCDGSVAFYTEVLGFDAVEPTEADGRLVRARVVNGAAQLVLSEQPEEVRTTPGGAAIFHLVPEDVEGLHASLVEQGVTVGPLAVSPSGARSFELVDPDGYELCFADTPPKG